MRAKQKNGWDSFTPRLGDVPRDIEGEHRLVQAKTLGGYTVPSSIPANAVAWPALSELPDDDYQGGGVVLLKTEGTTNKYQPYIYDYDQRAWRSLIHVETANIADSAVTTAKIADDAVTTAKIASQTWTTYTPTWSNLTLGTGATNEAAFIRIGSLVTVRFRFVLGTSPTVGTNPEMSLPDGDSLATFYDTNMPIGFALARDNSTFTNSTYGFMREASGGGVRFGWAQSNMGNPGGINSANPFTWAASDELSGQFTYEPASS